MWRRELLKRQICVNVEMGLLDKIDSSRGDIPRSRIVERILTENYYNLEPRKKDLRNGS